MGGSSHLLYFTAGPDGETHGLFGVLTPVPEPSSYALLLAGIGILGLWRQRRDWVEKIALCAVTTHVSLVRHFNWAHLVGSAHLAIATRNRLLPEHPLCRLMWPYMYGTQQSNDMVTKGQMVRGGDFETVFSFTFDGTCRLFDETYGDFRIVINDPEEHAKPADLDAGFDTPTQANLEALFNVMHAHARDYLRLYYPDAPPALRRGRALPQSEVTNRSWHGSTN